MFDSPSIFRHIWQIYRPYYLLYLPEQYPQHRPCEWSLLFAVQAILRAARHDWGHLLPFFIVAGPFRVQRLPQVRMEGSVYREIKPRHDFYFLLMTAPNGASRPCLVSHVFGTQMPKFRAAHAAFSASSSRKKSCKSSERRPGWFPMDRFLR